MKILRSIILCLFMGVWTVGAGAMSVTDDTAAQLVEALNEAQRHIEALSGRARNRIAQQQWQLLEEQFPLASDWMLQDALDEPLWAHVPAGGRDGWRGQAELLGPRLNYIINNMNSARWFDMTTRVLDELGDSGRDLADSLATVGRDGDEVFLAGLYLQACQLRRSRRLRPLLEQNWPGIVFARHYNMGASHYAYTEALSNAVNERNFRPGSSLCVLRLDGEEMKVETLLDSPEGVIRDVDVSWDGSTLLFSWKKSDRQDDYSLYTMDVDSGEMTMVIGDLGQADYEGVFLPDGDIMFNSTRCIQIVDCWWTEVSNIYAIRPDGTGLRRLGFDQVHTNYPTVTQDGRVFYTRWDYNDRGQLFPQGLFQMYPDGTAQMEFYGNTSWFPTTILHARDIPDSPKVLAIFTGHHSFQAGKLGLLDPRKGRQENEGAQLIAPVRTTPAERIDAYGQEGDLFMYPWPIDEHNYLVSYAPRGWEGGGDQRYDTTFGLYLMDIDGRRELLDLDTEQGVSTGRMVPLAPRPRPHVRPSRVDYTQDHGTYYVQDVYEGPGLEGVERGTIKNLRVVAIDYRVAGIGNNDSRGPGGSALVSTPIAIGGGSWDVKQVLGRAKVHEDGSAMFEVPARKPLYFQALDDQGQAVQTMRTWSTLQPGEFSSCVGCHSEDKHHAPPLQRPTRAMIAGAQQLEQPYSEQSVEGFSFQREIQPILDRHCIECHNDRSTTRSGVSWPGLPESSSNQDGSFHVFSLKGDLNHDGHARRMWSDSYLNLTHSRGQLHHPQQPDELVNWMSSQSVPSLLEPYAAGAAVSRLMHMLRQGHYDVELSSDELEMIALWIDLAVPFAGDYKEANAWTDEEIETYNRRMDKRRQMEAMEQEGIRQLLESQGRYLRSH